MPTIAHVAYRYLPLVGGIETYIENLRRVLDQAGYSQTVFQTDTGASADGVVCLPRIPHLPNQVSFSLSLRRNRSLWIDADVMLVHSPEYLLAVRKHPRKIAIMHGATWTAEDSRLRREVRRRVFSWAIRHRFPIAFNDTFVPRSFGLAVGPDQFFRAFQGSFWMIPNCVDCDFFRKQPTPYRDEKGRSVIVCARNFTYSKGADLAVEAFALFRLRHPDTVLWLVGDSFDDHSREAWYKRYLKETVTRLGVGDSVLFLGRQPYDKMPQILSAATLSLVPSRRNEATSLVALESMACSVATVSTAVEGLADLPTLKADTNAEAIASAMAEAFEDAERIGRRQREAVCRTFTLFNWAEAWKKLVASVLA